MSQQASKQSRRIIQLLLRPLARFCLRQGVYLQEVYECMKEVLLEEAGNHLREMNEPFNKSRISAMTGLQRKEITRLAEGGEKVQTRATLISKIIGQWQNDPRFLTKSKKPRVLRLDDFDEGFPKLVYAVSSDLNPASILFELSRIGAVEHSGERVELKVLSYSPSQNVEDAYEMLARDMRLFMKAVEENILSKNELPNLHLNTSYDKVRSSNEAEIRAWLIQEGHAFHARAREFISRFDQDLLPEIGYRGEYVQVMLGSFSVVSKEKTEK